MQHWPELQRRSELQQAVPQTLSVLWQQAEKVALGSNNGSGVVHCVVPPQQFGPLAAAQHLPWSQH
jgi:hypothetical protein